MCLALKRLKAFGSAGMPKATSYREISRFSVNFPSLLPFWEKSPVKTRASVQNLGENG